MLVPMRFFFFSERGFMAAALLSCVTWDAPAAEANPTARPESKVDFVRDIQPIFVKRCSECHGPDKQKGRLRLDIKTEALRGGDSGTPLLVPGKSSESEIIRRVTTDDSDDVMPAKGERLTPDQINLLRAWIDQGAVWPEVDARKHWAYLTPVRPPLPRVKNSRWVRMEIDHFILSRLEKEGLAPSKEADRTTLVRRLSLDLTGLPPTPQEVEAFLGDRSAKAYERLVDRLLDSPHYGEHIGRWWLDLARYADSNGYQVDLARSIWPYREWVINAFNRNLRFDQFTVEQLAGDLLPHATLTQKIATGFNRNTKINDEGGGDAEEYRTKAVKDRVATTATTWLGLTMMCAECHSHKYDPITQEEYYRFYAFFNNTTDGGNYSVEPTVGVPAPTLQAKVNSLHKRIAEVQGELLRAEARLPIEQADWERRVAAKLQTPVGDVHRNIALNLPLTHSLSSSEGERVSGGRVRGRFVERIQERGKSHKDGPPLPGPLLSSQGREGEIQGSFSASRLNSTAVGEGRGSVRARSNVWIPLDLTNAVSVGGSTFTNLDDRSILATGVNPIYDTITVEAETDLENITAILLETLPDPSLPQKGPGRWGKTGNFILDEFAASARPKNGSNADSTNVVFSHATADWEQQYYRAEHAVDRNPKTGWAIGPQFGKRHFLIAGLKDPIRHAGGSRLAFRLEHYHGNSHTIGRIRLSVTSETDPAALWPHDPEIGELLNTPAAQRTEEQSRKLAAYYRSVSPTIRSLERELFRLNEREAELANTKYTTLVMQERPEPRETFVHVRGNFLDKGKVVSPGVPAFLPSLPPNESPNRLALARWLIDPENPLTARVTVNRLWERFFGTGLVKTSEDFGVQGEAPSHPELLDWLATEFTRLGWDVKAIQKLIVMSAAYRQSAATTDGMLNKDLFNRLLARGPRFRLDPEIVRDQALAVSGLLNAEIGGPSVYPVQPANLWKEIGFLRPEIGMDEWPLSEGRDLYRRGVYTFWRRVCTYPMFATFDAPSREVCTARRPRTNTPLQALAALNESTLLEAARVFAQRIMQQGGARPAKQIEFAFRLCTSRPPTTFERERLLSFYEQQVRSFERDPAAAEALLNVGFAERPPNLDLRQLAAWMMVANVLLNLDEMVTKG
jgi:mono/diheme cytochrome c family protein/prefoldin subunit 5